MLKINVFKGSIQLNDKYKYFTGSTTKDNDFRATNAKKTIEKFAQAYREHKRRYGAQAVEEKLEFQLIANQLIGKTLIEAIDALSNGTARKGDVERQAKQVIAAAGLKGKPLARMFHPLFNLSLRRAGMTSCETI